MKVFDIHIKLFKLSVVILLLTVSQTFLAQSDDQVSSFLDDFMNQIEEGGVTIDEQYLQDNAGMPSDMKASLRDSLQGNETFVLTKDKASDFLSNFSTTIEKYGFVSDGQSIKLKNNRFLNLSIKGPNLADLFGGNDPMDSNVDTTSADFKVHDINSDLYKPSTASNLDLKDPANNTQEVVFDPKTGTYVFSNTIGDEELNVPVEMDGEEYLDHTLENSLNKYWEDRSFSDEAESGSLLNMGLDFSGSSKMFGKGALDIKPQGYADLTFSIKTNKTDNPTVSEDRRKNTYFDLDNKIQMNVIGSVGDKVNLDMNYNTEATFDFDNQLKLEFNGKEDDILKHFKAGNVSMPSVGSMITVGGNGSSGGQSGMILPGYQKLWGFQNTQQYGKLTWAWVVSQQESETETMTLEGGATKQDFEITVDDYDANRHFFLTHFFKQNYDNWMAYLPNTDVSGLNINKIEVWVTNKRGDFEQARNVVSFMDLGEPNAEDIDNENLWTPYGGKPRNDANSLYKEMNTTYSEIRDINKVSTTLGALAGDGFVNGEDYEKVENARLLSPSEYRVNTTLGYISLRSSLNADEVLSVAFQYTYRGVVYQVGEFSSGDGVTAPNSLYLKMLKATNQSPSLPMWDLMMKNIYALNAYNVSKEDFFFSIVHFNEQIGTEFPYITEGDINEELLLRVMGLDTLNTSNEPGPDGFFDWVEGYTIKQDDGRVIFPVREPFGNHLRKKIGNDLIAERYIFQELYDTTLVAARQMAEKNKFRLKGSYKSASGSEIKLNAFNIPRGSVKVTAGGRQLVENVDYTVDYNSGYLRILNQGIMESGQTVQVSMENQALFSMQKKTLLGTNLVYRFNDDLQIGASVTHLRERPQTTKVAMGNDPIANTVWGFTGGWNTELPFLTKAMDKLPFTDTKAPSSMTVRGEIAQLIAGHHSSIGESGAVYVDDFEATKIGINIQNYFAWDLASVPRAFKESELSDSLDYGFNRAKIAWYSIDRMMQEDRAETPSNIDEDERSNHYVRSVDARNLFPKQEQSYGQTTYLPILNLAYYPDEKGPYNYTTDLDERGRLNNPETRWGGITRKIETPNFENTNIEYIEFWMMDPFIYDENKDDMDLGGEMHINLGNISEDILKDGRKSFENGLPTSDLVEGVDTTVWGRVSNKQSLVNAFDNNDNSRQYQDVGLDGLNNGDETSFFANYVFELEMIKQNSPVEYHAYFDSLINDPSQDDYQYFRGSELDDLEMGVLDRYKNFNNHQGNSPSSLDNGESYSTAGTNTPDGEDIDQDFTLGENDSYYKYAFDINPRDTAVGSNFIVDTRIEKVKLANDERAEVKWYQFRIPVHEHYDKQGTITDFTSIRFMRMYMKGFKKPVVLRMANLELVRSEWRRYGREIEPDVYNPIDGFIDVEAVNYEENSDRTPVNYLLPPGVTRMTDPSQPQMKQLNEQSMVMRVRQLSGRDSRASYKVMQMDFRQYKRLQMWVHAEELPQLHNDHTEIEDEDLALFVRLGSDYNDNFYEYELPLYLTPAGYYTDDGENGANREKVWPLDNQLDFPLELLTTLKLKRNNNDIGYNELFTQVVPNKPKQKVTVKGNPTLSNVKMVMIGVRNTKRKTTEKLSAEVWVNELRLTGLEEDGGWSGNGNVSIKIADIGTASASGMFSTSGWGSIEQKLMDRQMSDNRAYDVSTSLELGKFLPRKAKIQMPMYYAYSQATSAPKYDPLNQDLLLQDEIDAAETKAEREKIKRDAQSFESRKSLNFSNVKVNVSGEKKRFYDPVNLSLNYAFSEKYAYNETLESGVTRDRTMGINYNFSPSPKPIEPFKSVKAFKSKHLALIRDFNFYLKPQKLAFTSNLDRNYHEQQMKDLSGAGLNIPLLVRKDLFFNNTFTFNYKLAKSLSVDYNVKTYAVIDELDVTDADGNLAPIRDLNNKLYASSYDEWRTAMLDSLMNFGRIMDYTQNFNVRYTVPMAKIPLLNFVAVDASYNSSYGWERGSQPYYYYTNDDRTDSIYINNGNTVRNTQRGTLNGSLKMTTLYKKSKYLANISKKYGRVGGNSRNKLKTAKYEQDGINAKKGEVIEVRHKLGASKATVRFFDANGKAIYGRKETMDDNLVHFVPNEDVVDGRVTVTARVPDKDSPAEKVFGYTVNALMALKSFNVNLTRDGSTTAPGFLPTNNLFDVNSTATPGWNFALGQQNRNIFTGEHKNDVIGDFNKNDWLVMDTTFSQPYMITEGDQVSLRGNIEPLPGLSLKLTSNYMQQERMSAFYVNSDGDFNNGQTNLSRSGNYSHTWIGISTLFEKQDGEFYSSKAYDTFLSNRQLIADKKRAQMTPEEQEKYKDVLYDLNSSEILIPAFLAAYSETSVNDQSTNIKPSWRSMLPNWQISYAGLARTKMLKDKFKTITLRHTYTCTYNVGSYITLTDFDRKTPPINEVDDQYFFGSKYDIASVTVSEGLNPLVGVDVTLKNNLSFEFALNKLRALSLNIASNQMIETRNDEIVIGAGYRFEDLKLFVKTSKDKKGRAVNNDLRINADFSIRDVATVIRRIDEVNVQPSSGNKVTAFKIQGIYNVNNNLDVTVFYDKQITSPVVSTSFRTSNSNFGITFRFSLTN